MKTPSNLSALRSFFDSLDWTKLQDEVASEARARLVIEQFTQNPAACDYMVTRLGEGDHATVVAVRSGDAQLIWRAHDVLVLKLFKAEATPVARARRGPRAERG